MSAKSLARCDPHAGCLPRKVLGKSLICPRCGGIPPSAALTYEGLDYVPCLCGNDRLANWCARVERLQH